MTFITKDAAQKLTADLLKQKTAPDATVFIGYQRNAVSRFANNAITQNTLVEATNIRVECAFEGRKGAASTTTLTPEALTDTLRRAEAIAKVAPPDPEYLPPLGPQTYLAPPGYSPETARLAVNERASRVLTITEKAAKAKVRASGTVESGESGAVLANSKGLFAYDLGSNGLIGTTMTAPDSSGWARDTAPDIRLLDPSALAEAALEQTRIGAAPKDLAPGKYTVILSPAAVSQLVWFMFYLMDGRSTTDGVTFLSNGKLGQKLTPEAINIYSDPLNSRAPGAAFGDSGLPQRLVKWVDQGVFKEVRWDRFTAQKQKQTPTPFPANLIMAGDESKSLMDLVKSTERGVFLTHVWYVRYIKPAETLLTGLTRDGTFLIENGKFAGGVKNLRFNESVLSLLQRVEAMSKAVSAVDNEAPPSLFPGLKVKDFNFVSATQF
ncbi:TldD/PmbA family protein [Candidatus Cyanaurora vandensis]|uniref:TldD/PmbA family protein n=1 Tax=Candidatus Cyanaurora vandensis TaxID=2714958 RepID=UPI00257DC118|nr:TldD/PmbA family protein [Candidatus Cyanaurora vandensis]